MTPLDQPLRVLRSLPSSISLVLKQSHSQVSRQACFMSQGTSCGSGPSFAHPDPPAGCSSAGSLNSSVRGKR